MRIEDQLTKYAQDTQDDMTIGDERATFADAVRAMRDEPRDVAKGLGCTVDVVIAWCKEQSK